MNIQMSWKFVLNNINRVQFDDLKTRICTRTIHSNWNNLLLFILSLSPFKPQQKRAPKQNSIKLGTRIFVFFFFLGNNALTKYIHINKMGWARKKLSIKTVKRYGKMVKTVAREMKQIAKIKLFICREREPANNDQRFCFVGLTNGCINHVVLKCSQQIKAKIIYMISIRDSNGIHFENFYETVTIDCIRFQSNANNRIDVIVFPLHFLKMCVFLFA